MLPAEVAFGGVRALFTAAPRLRWLALSGVDAGDAMHRELLLAAGQHPALRHLVLETDAGFAFVLPPDIASRLSPAVRYRPVNTRRLARMAVLDHGLTIEEWEERC